ncbi:MAG: hypothetical protein IJ981_04980 [Clostridia bacterium]|nr:hypothetical protein [Clostridia bacterium]
MKLKFVQKIIDVLRGKSGPVKLVDLLYDTYIKLGLTNVSKKLYPNMRHEILNEVDYTTPYNDLLDFINKNND